MVTLYGLKACDTCRKARQVLEKAGETVDFQDVRETPLEAARIAEFAQKFGESLINKRSTTWRNLSENERENSISHLIAHFPTVMKRPVIVSNGNLTLGWNAGIEAQHLGKGA